MKQLDEYNFHLNRTNWMNNLKPSTEIINELKRANQMTENARTENNDSANLPEMQESKISDMGIPITDSSDSNSQIRLTNAQLEELKSVCSKATPGPWECGRAKFSDENDDPDHKNVVWYGIILKDGPILAKANADYIAQARTALPSLIEEVMLARPIIDAAINYCKADDNYNPKLINACIKLNSAVKNYLGSQQGVEGV